MVNHLASHILMCCLLILVSCIKKSAEVSSIKTQAVKWVHENPPELVSTPYPMDSKPVLIQDARIMTATGVTYEKAHLLMQDGRIHKISVEKITPPSETQIIDGTGLTLTPGLIDVHSHMGVYPSPALDAHNDGNEMSRPVTADVWAEHAFWPQDPDLWRAMAGGVTTIQVLPGSGNLVGGRTMTLKLIPNVSPREMRFYEAPQGLKMACGENPKLAYKKKGLMTRMGNMAHYRKAYQEAIEYGRELEEAQKNKKTLKIPKRNFVSETLLKVLKGEILLHFHCYRADDISNILDLADEFGFQIRAIHHGLEAYKVAPRLHQKNVAVATWTDWWGFKAEAYDGIPYNMALLHQAGVKAVLHSDSPQDVRFLNIEAGKALSRARDLGIEISEEEALSWITLNAAWSLGLDDRIGSLEAGKMADVVAWDGHPFSAYSKAQMVFINGKKILDRKDKVRPRSDFEVGYNDMAFYDGRDFTPAPLVDSLTFPELQTSNDKEVEKLSTFYLKNSKAFINGQWMNPAHIHVKKGVVVSVSKEANFPENVPVIDGRLHFVTPGFIDSISTLGLFEIELDTLAQDLRGDANLMTPAFRAADALNSQSIRVPIWRRQGVTTTISNNSLGLVGGQGVAFDLVESNAVVKESAALFSSLQKSRWGQKNNRSQMWSQLRQLLQDSRLYQQKKQAYQNGQTRPLLLDELHMQALTPFLRGQKPWVFEVQRVDDIRNLLQLKKYAFSLGFNIQFVIQGGAEAWLAADDLKRENIPVMMTPTHQTPQTFDQTKARFDSPAYLASKGVQVIITDHGDLGAPRLRQEAAMAVKYGLPHNEAIKAITSHPAQVFGFKQQGQIQVGQPAHFVLWSGDPLEPTSRAERVWIGGEEQDLKTRHLELGRKYLAH